MNTNQENPCPLCGKIETKVGEIVEPFVCAACGQHWPNNAALRVEHHWSADDIVKFQEGWDKLQGRPRKVVPGGEFIGGSSLHWILMTDPFVDVVAFHRKFGLEYKGPPRELPADLQTFRTKFMDEELDEYKAGVILLRHAITEDERTEAAEQMLDSLVDLVYVALGTAHMHGFDFNSAWRKVQEANMAKVRCERAEDSKRGSTFDVIKPAGWVAPDHKDLVRGIVKNEE